MSKHERRAPRQSQLRLKVEGKDPAVQMARTGLLLAPKQRTGLLQHVQSLAPNQQLQPHVTSISAEMALGLRQTSHSAGHWRFLPPFFFCGCWCNFFFNAPLAGAKLAFLNEYAPTLLFASSYPASFFFPKFRSFASLVCCTHGAAQPFFSC